MSMDWKGKPISDLSSEEIDQAKADLMQASDHIFSQFTPFQKLFFAAQANILCRERELLRRAEEVAQ